MRCWALPASDVRRWTVRIHVGAASSPDEEHDLPDSGGGSRRAYPRTKTLQPSQEVETGVMNFALQLMNFALKMMTFRIKMMTSL